MKSLIIPDIHNNHTLAETIIGKVKPDHTYFLGDYFDNFDDTYEEIAETADWLSWSVYQKDRTHLMGNHDVHYRFAANSGIRCGGYEQAKSVIIENRVKPEHWKQIKFFAYVGDWLLSHAGIHPYWIDAGKLRNDEPVIISKDDLTKKLERDSIDCITQLEKGKTHWFVVAGWARSRSPFVGGLLWCDFNEEFSPLRGIHQIIGHTPSRDKIRWKVLKSGDPAVYAPAEGAKPELNENTSFNVCFDSYPALKWYGILEGNELSIHETKDALK